MKKTTAWWFSSIACFLWFASPVVHAQETYVCVWRNPERTMTRLFPEARDYRTVTTAISPEALVRIEKRTGAPLLPGQREQFQYFEMLDAKGAIVGYTHAMTQKGEFGAIEMVFGKDPEHRVATLYIQRQRERERGFRDPEFLARFDGLTPAKADAFADPAAEAGTLGTRAVTLGVRTALIVFDELVRPDPAADRSKADGRSLP